MKLKKLIQESIELLGRKELLENNIFDEVNQNAPTSSERLEIDLLVKKFNLIYKEVASNYLPLLFEEEIQFIDNQFDFANLTNSILEVYKLENTKKMNVNFELFPSYIKADIQNAKIVYSYLPDDMSLDSEAEINFFSGKLLPQVLLYGIAREYCLFNGFYTEAKLWDDKFKDGILYAMRKKSPIILKARRWF